MLHFSIPFCQPIAHFLGVVIKRSVASLVRYAPVLIKNVEPLGPCSIGIVRGIVHLIDAKRHRVFEPLGKVFGNRNTLLDGLRLRVADIVFFFRVRFHLPFVGGMCFAHIDGQKIRMVLIVLLLERLHVATLGDERGSSESANTTAPGGVRPVFSNMELRAAIERQQPCVRRIIANLQISTMHMRQRITHHAVSIFRAASHDAQSDEDEHYQRRNRDQPPFKYWIQTQFS